MTYNHDNKIVSVNNVRQHKQARNLRWHSQLLAAGSKFRMLRWCVYVLRKSN